jgi:hypothetical protein
MIKIYEAFIEFLSLMADNDGEKKTAKKELEIMVELSTASISTAKEASFFLTPLLQIKILEAVQKRILLGNSHISTSIEANSV